MASVESKGGFGAMDSESAPRLRALAAISSGRLFLILYALSLIAALAFGLAVRFRTGVAGLEADEAEYYQMASQILNGTLDWNARRTLAFPLLIATLRRIDDNILFVQVVTTALYALSAPLLALLVRKVTRSAEAAALGGLVLALWLPSIFYGTSLYSECVALPMLLLTLLALPIGSRVADGRVTDALLPALMTGVLLGLTTHVRTMYLLFTPFIVLIMAVEEASLRRFLQRAVAVAAGFCAVILPWSLTMSEHFHHPILVTANGGETLAGGLNPTLANARTNDFITVAGRAVWTGPGKWIPMELTGYLTPEELKLPYDQADALLQQRTREWIRTHPGAALRLQLSKLGYMWGITSFFANGYAQALAGSLPTVVMLAIGLVALATWPAARVGMIRFWTLPVFASCIALISWGSWRFRQPGDAGMIALDVAALCYLASRRGLLARRMPA